MKVNKLSNKTSIRDCSKSLWRWLEMTENDVRGHSREWSRYPSIGDLPFEVWVAKHNGIYAYGTTAFAAIDNAVKMRDAKMA